MNRWPCCVGGSRTGSAWLAVEELELLPAAGTVACCCIVGASMVVAAPQQQITRSLTGAALVLGQPEHF